VDISFVNNVIKIALIRSISAQNAPNTVWWQGSTRTRWESALPQPHSWIKGSLLLMEEVWEGSGGREGKERGGRRERDG